MRRHYTLTAVGNLQLREAVFYTAAPEEMSIYLAVSPCGAPLWTTSAAPATGSDICWVSTRDLRTSAGGLRRGHGGSCPRAGNDRLRRTRRLYEGQYGISIETISKWWRLQRKGTADSLRFSPLTLVPLDPALIDPDCLTPQTRDALNRYHKRVFEEIAPLLNEEGAHMA